MNVRKKVDISMERRSSQDSSVEKDKADHPDFENYTNPEMALLYTNREDQIQTQKLSVLSHEDGGGTFKVKYKTVERGTPDRYSKGQPATSLFAKRTNSTQINK
jgi:hypothetical protein